MKYCDSKKEGTGMNPTSESPLWEKICSSCREGIYPTECEFFGEPNGCNSPTYGMHPKQNVLLNAHRFESLDAAVQDYGDEGFISEFKYLEKAIFYGKEGEVDLPTFELMLFLKWLFSKPTVD